MSLNISDIESVSHPPRLNFPISSPLPYLGTPQNVHATSSPSPPRYFPSLPAYLLLLLILTPSHRQTDRPPYPRRAQSLLRQRAHLPLLAQFHRYPRRSRHRSFKLRRQRWSYIRSAVHDCGNGDDAVCACDVSLAGQEYTDEGARGV